jgi:hypothetical protein
MLQELLKSSRLKSYFDEHPVESDLLLKVCTANNTIIVDIMLMMTIIIIVFIIVVVVIFVIACLYNINIIIIIIIIMTNAFVSPQGSGSKHAAHIDKSLVRLCEDI